MENAVERIWSDISDGVLIDRSEYEDLLIARAERDNLLNAIFSDCVLDWSGEKMVDEAHVLHYVKSVYPNRYRKKVQELKAKRDEERRKYEEAQRNEADLNK